MLFPLKELEVGIYCESFPLKELEVGIYCESFPLKELEVEIYCESFPLKEFGAEIYCDYFIIYRMNYSVYILANKKNGTLYIGVTNDLVRRIYEHKEKKVDGFTKKYEINYLVYYETTNDIKQAIAREKELKHWNREWKIRLIEKDNPEWSDLYITISKL